MVFPEASQRHLRPTSGFTTGSTTTTLAESSTELSAMEKRDPSVYDNVESPPLEHEDPLATTRAASHTGAMKDDLANGDLRDKVAAGVEEAKEQDSAEDEDESKYPKGIKLLLITIALSLSVFCIALDNTIISTAIPRITDQFRALDDVGWYGSAYLLTTCAFQLIFGKLYTYYSIKWVYMVALFLFELGSLVCGIAPTSDALIIGRAIAGLGSAGIFSGAILIVAHTVPLRQRPTYTGIIGAMYGIASVAGPLMGGAFTDRLTWRWCFYINLPFGAITALFIIFFFKSPGSSKKVARSGWKAQLAEFDLIGTLFFLPAIISLLLALQWGGSKYAWGNGRIIGLFVVFGVLICCFIAVQVWKQEQATVPPRVFKNRSVWSSALFGAALGGSFFIIVYYIPIWFQAIKGASAVKSGIMNLPMILSLVVVSLIAGGAITKIGYYTPFMIASSVVMAIGAGLIATFKPNTGHAKWIGYQVVYGCGVGLGMQQTLIAVQAALPLADVPIGTAIMMFSQTLGGALFISVGQNVFTNSLIKNIVKNVPDLNPLVVITTGATALKHVVDQRFLPGVLEAYNTAIVQCFYVSVALASLSIVGAVFVEWKSVKGKKIEMAAA